MEFLSNQTKWHIKQLTRFPVEYAGGHDHPFHFGSVFKTALK
jgi:hypothetical protein